GPTIRLIGSRVESRGRKAVISSALAQDAFCETKERLVQALISASKTLVGNVDAVVLAQSSMAVAAEDLQKALGIPVLSSVSFGVDAVCRAAKRLETIKGSETLI
ncbi:MAG: Asp/Glu/hydantoin racemase, partial [Clostridia bacterium]|nr:Asp/Glu/hydantoin racemase [Clostridia bacterium]